MSFWGYVKNMDKHEERETTFARKRGKESKRGGKKCVPRKH